MLAYQTVRWEQLKKKKIFQCKNCQRIGHASSNCNMNFRCVKCAQSHGPKSCPLEKTSSREKLLCANCGNAGHPASYHGCPYIKKISLTIDKKNNAKSQNIRQQTEFTSNYIQSGKSFREAMTGHQHSTNIPHPNNTHQHQQYQPNTPHQQQHQDQFNQIPFWFQQEKTMLNDALKN